MLKLSRKIGETVIINDHIKVTLLDIYGTQARFGIAAPDDVLILRTELIDSPKHAAPEQTEHKSR